MIEAVVFDMDGLMLDTETIYKRAWQSAARDLGYDLDDDFYATLIGRALADGETALASRFGPAFPLEEFGSRWSRAWKLDVQSAGIPPKPGLHELLAILERRDVPVAVATSTYRDAAELTLRAGGLDTHFQVVVSGDEVLRGKPAPDIYVEAARRLGVNAARCLALEDSDAGVLSSSRAAMLTLMVPDLKPPSPEAAAAAFQVFASLLDARPTIVQLLEDGKGSDDHRRG
jgi:beta-phosphoglucomutase